MKDSQTKVTVVLLIITLCLAAGLGYYFGTITTAKQGSTVTETASSSSSASPYVLALVITTNNVFNSTVGAQPAYYVVGPDGLQSSANITLPAHTLIEVVIQNYDTGGTRRPAAPSTTRSAGQ